MNQLLCRPDGSCPFLHSCVDNLCVHDPLLPPTVYTAFVYLLIPLLLSLANVGGLSGGFLKVPLLMDLLNYSSSIATYYTYPLIFGGGLANLLLLVPQRHPTYNRPVIDYNLANVLLPCTVVGSTIGVICNLLIPSLVQDILIILLFLFISYIFIKKYRDYKLQKKIDSGELRKQLLPNSPNKKRPSSASSAGSQELSIELVKIIEDKEDDEHFDINNSQLDKLLKQDEGMRLKNIIASFAIYAFFQLLALFTEGKLYKFKLCTPWFFGCMFVAFMTIFFIFLIGLFFYMRKKYTFYNKVQYKYQVDLSISKNFVLVALGGILGGFSTGLLGAGCGHIMIIFMDLVGVHTKVASATSGYQIVFIGSSSLIQALAQKSLTWVPLLFFSVLSFVGSFILSIAVYKLCQKLPDKGMGPIIIILIIMSFINIVGVIPNMVMTSLYYGFGVLLSVPGFKCA